ncbi:hypothetical protein jhhlp_008542 [Lomentospora prolificans]|uniref:Zn(2)-C6 fungal-type domain-containing protein n=1 Tax=Lomentospora prolificans TaxID=41688 RepID=A0A2N3MYC3_9PEZI|nr:hypothetical protein jhhlp_008542 [Lomentospora prolificans]
MWSRFLEKKRNPPFTVPRSFGEPANQIQGHVCNVESLEVVASLVGRIRRVKCDETRPNCRRCVSSRRTCDGYLPANVTLNRRSLADLVRQTPSLGPAAQTLAPVLRQSPDPKLSALDATFFDMFRLRTGPGTASLLPSSFWTHDLLKLAHIEPAVWHATLSLGALHHHWEADQELRRASAPLVPYYTPSNTQVEREALSHYFRAISLAKDIKDTAALRSLSITLVAIANILGRWSDCRTHLFGGLRLLDREDARSQGEVDSTAEMLERLDLQAMSFSDSQAPYPYGDPVWLKSLHRKLHDTDTISNHGQAATLLFALLRQFILTSASLAEEKSSLEAFQLDLLTIISDLVAWERKMEILESNHPQPSISSVCIRLYHAQLRLWLLAFLDGPEERWDTDECLFYFEYLIDLAEELITMYEAQSATPFSLEPAVIAPLFSAAHRCRHPQLRWRAIHLLRSCNRQEGMWSSVGAAAVVERVVLMEERAFPHDINAEERKVDMTLLMSAAPGSGAPYKMVRDTASF